MKKLLSKFNLGDAYEIQARVLPAMLVVLPIAILVGQIAWRQKGWLAVIGWGTGLEVVFAILVSKLGHAMGARLQDRLTKEWGGLPTMRWLRPNDPSHSEQQKKIWRKAVSTLSGLKVDRELKGNDLAEADRVIEDAIVACRNKVRSSRKADLLNKHNVAFGFARNLAGMRWLALSISLVCLLASTYGTIEKEWDVAGTILQGAFFVIAAVNCFVSINYVKHCSIRYAEFFFVTVVAITDD